MDTLSSCYFCSTALDASLDEYPVVPDRLRAGGDPTQTVVLCETCARKLDAVFESVVDAVERDADSGAGSESASDADRANTDADEDSLESTLGDDDDVLQSVGDGAESTERGESSGDASSERDESSDESSADDDGSDSKERKYTDSRGAGFRRDDDDGPTRPTLRDDSDDKERKYSDSRGAGWRRDDEQRNGASGSAGAADDGGSDSGRATGDEHGGSSGSASNGGSGRDANGRTGGESGRDESGDTSGTGGSGDGSGDEQPPDVSLSRLENTKVMRLLENREFPVDKEEFVTVAASAYQISRHDCEKVLDLAVQHDLIDEENGQLVGNEL